MNKLETLLSSVDWDDFLFTDVFTSIGIASASDYGQLEEGSTPFVGRSSIKNGLQGEVSISEDKINNGSTITVAMVATTLKAFYQDYSFTCSQNILLLENKKEMNKYSALFLCTVIDDYLKVKGYGYGYPVSLYRIKRNKLYLPTTSSGEPNWYIMSEFMQLIEKEATPETLLEPHAVDDMRNLNDVKWDSFRIENYAEISGGRDIYARERFQGGKPYITSTAANNGIGYFVGNSNNSLERNCISINRNGSVGYAFYHNYSALYGNDVRKIKLKNNLNDNKYVSLFFTTTVMQQKDKYSYSVKMGTKRLKKQEIMLPINDNGDPDWYFMEQYMKRIENELLSKVNTSNAEHSVQNTTH